jgi:hypothetical protein
MPSSSSQSAADLALAARRPQAAASRQCLDALDDSGPSDIALSLRRRRERNCLSAIAAGIRPVAVRVPMITRSYTHCAVKPRQFARPAVPGTAFGPRSHGKPTACGEAPEHRSRGPDLV